MARRRVFVRCEELAFLEDTARWRQQCILVLTRATPQGPLYKAVEGVVDAIDGLAEVVSRWRAAVPPTEPSLAWAGPTAREVADGGIGSHPSVNPVAPITMPPDRLPRIQVTALRACGHHPQGMRHSAHLKTMRSLQGLGYVEERAPHLRRDLRWFLTPAGHEVLVMVGTGERPED
jgi:hypothetical protein